MIYLISNENDFLIKKEISKIIKKFDIDEYNINTYSMINDDLQLILEDFETYSMFDDKKIVIVNDSIAFTSKKNEIDITLLDNYINNFNESTIVIFSTNEKLDERKKIVKKIRETGCVLSSETLNIEEIVKEFLENYKMDNQNIKLLIDRVGTDIYELEQEINKLKIYKDNELTITKEDILNLTNENKETDIFKLIEDIINKDKKKAIKDYRELINKNEEPIIFIAALANKLRMIYQIKEFLKRGYTETDIATILKIKPGYIYFLKKIINKYESNDIINLLEELSKLDFEIKSGRVDKYQAFELFILKN